MSNVNVVFIYKNNQKQESVDKEKTIQQVISIISSSLNIPKEYEAYNKDKKLINDKKIKDLISTNSNTKSKEVFTITIKDKEEKSRSSNKSIKENKDNVNKSVNNEANNQQDNLNRIKLKIVNTKALGEVSSLIESELSKLPSSSFSIASKDDKSYIINFSKEVDGYKLYEKIQQVKSNNLNFANLNVLVYLGKAQSKDYRYPALPKDNINNSYRASEKKNKSEFNTINNSSLNNSVITRNDKMKGLNNSTTNSSSLSQFNNISHILKKNPLLHIDYSIVHHDIVKYREVKLKKQQEMLNIISPSLNRISAPYMSAEEKRLYYENKDKVNWIDKKGFNSQTSLFAARKLPFIKNYVGASPSNPPVLYKFRSVEKKRWIGKSGFKVC